MNNSRIIWPIVSFFGSLKSFHIVWLTAR